MNKLQELMAARAKIMQAWAEGHPLEARSVLVSLWSVCILPSFNWEHYDYRLAPPKPREWYVWYKHGEMMYQKSYDIGEQMRLKGFELIKVREVICECE